MAKGRGRGRGGGGLCCVDTAVVNVVLVVLNTLIVAAGLAVLGVGIWLTLGGAVNAYTQYQDTNAVMRGLSENPWLYILAGGIMAGVGTLGILSVACSSCGNCLACVYSILMIVALLFLVALTALAWVAYAITGPGNSAGITEREWRLTVAANPQFVCSQEKEYSCAGFSAGDCSPPSPDAQLCPGASVGGDCAQREAANAQKGCGGPVNKAVQQFYLVTAIVVTVALGVAAVCYLASLWRACCSCGKV